jgi:hypothetical protein
MIHIDGIFLDDARTVSGTLAHKNVHELKIPLPRSDASTRTVTGVPVAYVRGLLAPLASKNGWTLAEFAGDATPDGVQRLLNQRAWDADGVRDDVRAGGPR